MAELGILGGDDGGGGSGDSHPRKGGEQVAAEKDGAVLMRRGHAIDSKLPWFQMRRIAHARRIAIIIIATISSSCIVEQQAQARRRSRRLGSIFPIEVPRDNGGETNGDIIGRVVATAGGSGGGGGGVAAALVVVDVDDALGTSMQVLCCTSL